MFTKIPGFITSWYLFKTEITMDKQKCTGTQNITVFNKI